jgi:hypothetical protein
MLTIPGIAGLLIFSLGLLNNSETSVVSEDNLV